MTNLLSLDLNLLRVLDALFRGGSTIAAANQIGLSQPAVSAALKRLRHALNDPLFIRQGQRLVPTDYARKLELPLRDILHDLETLLSGPESFDPATSHETFRLAGSDFFAEHLLPMLAKRLSDQAPNMRVVLTDVVLDNQIENFSKHNLDVALVPSLPLPGWLQAKRVATSHFVFVARMGHPEIQRTGIKPGDVVPLDLLCALNHALFSYEGRFEGVTDRALHKIGRRRNVMLSAPSFAGVYTTVSESDAVALLPHQTAEKVAERIRLEIYRPPLEISPIPLDMIWHKRDANNPAHSWLRTTLDDLLAPMRAPPKIWGND